MGPETGWLRHTHSVTQGHPGFHVTPTGADRSPWNRGLISKWKSHLQLEVLPPIRGDWRWDLHLEVIPLFQGDGVDIRSQVDINTCTNACTHAKEAVG